MTDAVLTDTTQVALERAMSGAALRQQALAANVANANTPGYQRTDVDFHAALQSALGADDPGAAVAAVTPSAQTDPSGAVRADGSTIDVDAESAKLAANGLEYEALASAAKARMDIMRSAMGVA